MMAQVGFTIIKGTMTTPPIVVLNLKRRADRWAAWIQEAERVGLANYTRWEAIDGRTIAITPDIQKLFLNNDFNMRRGVVGCALTHMNVWLHIVENNIPALIILEDDALLNEPLTMPDLPRGWDIFYYGGAVLRKQYEPPEGPVRAIYPPGIPINDQVLIPKFPDHMYFTAVGYMLSYTGASKLLNRLGKVGFNKPVDRFMRDAFEILNVFSYRKLVVYANLDLTSDVDET